MMLSQPSIGEVREKFKRLFTQFDELAKEERSLKLFVRAVATSSELGRARDLMEAGSRVCAVCTVKPLREIMARL